MKERRQNDGMAEWRRPHETRDDKTYERLRRERMGTTIDNGTTSPNNEQPHGAIRTRRSSGRTDNYGVAGDATHLGMKASRNERCQNLRTVETWTWNTSRFLPSVLPSDTSTCFVKCPF